jgi:hypothetical protein
MRSCEACYETLCERCDEEKGHTFQYCARCYGSWCDDCLGSDDDTILMFYCSGSEADSDGCFESFCAPCVRAGKNGNDSLLLLCTGCDGFWCHECMTIEALGCRNLGAEAHDPRWGLYKAESSLLPIA